VERCVRLWEKRDAVLHGIRQIVILAAGMDARAYRMECLKGARLFEVERPEILEYKETILKTLGAKPLVLRTTVATDLREDFAGVLREAGYMTNQTTLFLMEGLLPYLPNEVTVSNLLSRVAAIAASGSILALDTIGESFLGSPWTQPFLELMTNAGAGWQFGTDDPEGLLEGTGFTNVHVVQPSEFLPDRWPFPSFPRSVPGIPRTYLVTGSRA
jgi:methyltransferase (TIGR00027 family)